jgi:hypothetical protein
MKVGLSYSRCIRDIVDGTVDINDVIIVIARTNFDPRDDAQWKGIWLGYGGGSSVSNMLAAGGFFSHCEPEWAGYMLEDEDKFRQVTIKLWETGKLHQPRKFGINPPRRPEFWLETCLPDSELERNPAAKKAWDHFQTIAGLTNVNVDKEYK